jgi:hypothetical protein
VDFPGHERALRDNCSDTSVYSCSTDDVSTREARAPVRNACAIHLWLLGREVEGVGIVSNLVYRIDLATWQAFAFPEVTVVVDERAPAFGLELLCEVRKAVVPDSCKLDLAVGLAVLFCKKSGGGEEEVERRRWRRGRCYPVAHDDTWPP